jgi:hypothetical protein
MARTFSLVHIPSSLIECRRCNDTVASSLQQSLFTNMEHIHVHRAYKCRVFDTDFVFVSSNYISKYNQVCVFVSSNYISKYNQVCVFVSSNYISKYNQVCVFVSSNYISKYNQVCVFVSSNYISKYNQVCVFVILSSIYGLIVLLQGHLGLWLDFSMLNHSCWNNAVHFTIEDRMVVRAARTIRRVRFYSWQLW